MQSWADDALIGILSFLFSVWGYPAGDNREEGCSQGRKEAKETGQQKAMKMLPSICCSHLGPALTGSGNPRIHRPGVSSLAEPVRGHY